MAEPTLKLTGAFSGALGEARIEAIQNSKDWFELHKQQLDDAQAKVAAQEQESMLREFPQFAQYQISPDGKSFEHVLTPEGQAMLQARVDAKFNYKGGLQKLSEDRAKMGKIDFCSEYSTTSLYQMLGSLVSSMQVDIIQLRKVVRY